MTPYIIRPVRSISASSSISTRTLTLGGLLALYPLAHVMAALALLGSTLLNRPAAREAATPVTES
jgi:hypothetical protein